MKVIKHKVPASEVWLFKNAKALASVRLGLYYAGKGKVSKIDAASL